MLRLLFGAMAAVTLALFAGSAHADTCEEACLPIGDEQCAYAVCVTDDDGEPPHCEHSYEVNGTACGPETACSRQRCIDGFCIAETTDCDDDNPLTEDSCDDTSGCVNRNPVASRGPLDDTGFRAGCASSGAGGTGGAAPAMLAVLAGLCKLRRRRSRAGP